MSLGDSWTGTTPNSSSKFNITTVISGTGAYLASLSKPAHKILVCTSTGSGFTVNHVYLVNADGSSVTDITAVQSHSHDSSSTGGSLVDVLRSNINVFDTGAQFITRMEVDKWKGGASGTGTQANDVDGTTGEYSVELDTGATNASTSQLYMPSLEMDCAKSSFYKILHKFGTASSVALKVGIGMEGLHMANSNTRKYGHEICTSVNNNYFATSADGTTRSSSDTGTAFDILRTSFRMEHYPDLGTPKVDLYINEGTVFSKTSNIPTTYANDEPSPEAMFRISLKNNTGASRTLKVFGVRFVYQGSSKWDEQ